MKKRLFLFGKIIVIFILVIFVVTTAHNLMENYKNIPTQDYSVEQDQTQKKFNQIVDNEKANTDASWQRFIDRINGK